MIIDKNLTKTKEDLKTHFNIGKSFDIVGRELVVGGVEAYMVMIDGFAKDDMLLHITSRLQRIEYFSGSLSAPLLIKSFIGYMEAEEVDDFSKIEDFILSGAIALFVDSLECAIIIDARTYPVRSPQEPDLEKVSRGPRDGFVETIIFNTALIRRRIKDPNLIFEIKTVGKQSKTNVVMAYMQNNCEKEYVEQISKKIDAIKVKSLVMAEKSLVELLIEKKWWNPLPQARFTERPDVAASHLLEGHLIIMVDTTPSVIILPTTIFHFTQHAEDYYQNVFIGTYLRWVRFAIMILSLVLTPLWLLVAQNPELLPQSLEFIGPEKHGTIPLLVQFLVLEFGIDVLRLSSIHTPSSLSTSLGIIGGLMLGQMAIDVGWFIPETVLYMSIVGIGTFATPSLEFAMAIRIFRLFLLILTGVFHIPGFIIGLIIEFSILAFTKNGSKRSFLWPLIPLNLKALGHVIFRSPTPKK